jgi:hypothetical protein
MKNKRAPMTDFSTSRKHSMDYVTVNGVILRTGYSNKRDWYLVCIRELLDNAADFLWEFYKGFKNATIVVEIFKDNKLFRLKVRNSNDHDIPVFSKSDISAIFDYEGRYGSKQDVHVISRGMLGDALKQVLAFGYALLHTNDNGMEFVNKQWKEPLIIRHNGIELKYVLEVDKINQRLEAKQVGEERKFNVIGPDTEIELVLPIVDEVKYSLDRLSIEEFCRKYPIFSTDISFNFSITDNSDTCHQTVHKDLDYGMRITSSYNDLENDTILARGLLETIAKGPPKAKIRIDFPALHRITVDQWNKTDSIHSYKAEEFSRRLLNVVEKRTSVYELLRRFREGTNIKRTKANEISIEKLISLPKDELGRMLENYYDELKSALPPPTRISLPHKTNRKFRMNTLKSRVAALYDIETDKEAVYKPVYGQYKDGSIGYPFFLELYAIPFKHADKARTVFIGAVNYSISPKENGNIFEGEYSWYDEKNEYHFAEDIIKVLEAHKFNLIHAQGFAITLSCNCKFGYPKTRSTWSRQIPY